MAAYKAPAESVQPGRLESDRPAVLCRQCAAEYRSNAIRNTELRCVPAKRLLDDRCEVYPTLSQYAQSIRTVLRLVQGKQTALRLA